MKDTLQIIVIAEESSGMTPTAAVVREFPAERVDREDSAAARLVYRDFQKVVSRSERTI